MPKTALKMIPIELIIEGDRFRKDYGEIDSLADSIREKGILQPITLDPNMNILAGGRRYTAAKIAQIALIPALVREIEGEIDAREIELMENIQRKEMNWQERVALTSEIDRLYKAENREWSGRKTAELLGKSRGGVNRHLQLAEAIDAVPELAKCKTEDDAFKLMKKAEKHMIVKALRKKQDTKIDSMPFVKHAKTHFEIADAFVGIQELIDEQREFNQESNITLLEVDPPYGIDLNEQKKGDGIDHDYKEVSGDEYQDWLKNLCHLLYKVAAKDAWVIFWFGPTWFTEVKVALLDAGFLVDDIPCIWNKGRGQTMQPKLYLGRAYEPFFVARKGNPTLNKEGRSNVFDFPPLNPADKWHPTQRPVALIEEILETFALPATICLVPFLGSGATLMAAYKKQMSAFGFDLNQKCKDRFLIEVEEEFKQKELDEAIGG